MAHYKVLIVDDHPMIVAGFTQALDIIAEDRNTTYSSDSALNCTDAAELIKNPNIKYDLISLDLSLPGSPDKKYNSGEDLALLAQKKQPQAKIMICTMLENNYKVLNVMKRLDPDSLLVKSDTNPEILMQAMQSLFAGKSYHSNTVQKMMKQNIDYAHELDEEDRKILYLLSQGILTKNIPENMNLSLSSVEKRKKQIKLFFNIPDRNDKILIEKAKERGFL
ncbi:MAG: response regulator [Psychroflexus sp.]